jgi:uncharacterized membrane protein
MEHTMVHPTPDLAQLSTATVVHLFVALGALALGPVALTARKGTPVHRAAGYTWVLLMLAAAVSSLFIHGGRLPNLAGFSPIHLLSVYTLVMLTIAMVAIFQRRISAHRRAMKGLYLGACLGAGAFALLPGRFLGDLVWHHTLGLLA